MNKTSILTLLAFASTAAFAHVSLQEPRAEAGSTYNAVLRVGHGCDGAATTALTVQLPSGFKDVRPAPKDGWTASVKSGAVTWTAGKDAALPSGQKGEFVLAGALPRTAGPLWFKVMQQCGDARMDWAQVPATGTSTDGLKTPAVLLEVLSPRDFAQLKMLPTVEGAWVRSSVTGQQGTGAFMKITAKEPMQLVGVSTPVAGTAEVHEMKMDGQVMRMRPVPVLDLPAGQAVELKPGGYHLMLQDLKQPLQKDSTVPMTLLLRNAKGEESKLELKLPVATQAPGTAAGGAPEHVHKH
jgi:copper(I)-binding protein